MSPSRSCYHVTFTFFSSVVTFPPVTLFFVRFDVCPGVYAVVLTAIDNAGNYQAARRFLIFDNVNVVSIKSAEENIIVVNSAAENTSYNWLTSLQGTDNTGDQVSKIVWLMLTYHIIESSSYSVSTSMTFSVPAPGYVCEYLAE